MNLPTLFLSPIVFMYGRGAGDYTSEEGKVAFAILNPTCPRAFLSQVGYRLYIDGCRNVTPEQTEALRKIGWYAEEVEADNPDDWED